MLSTLEVWEPYLREHSGLPGPRANLELVQAAAEAGNEQRFRRWLGSEASGARPNTPEEFLVLCGVVGLGRLLAEGRTDLRAELRRHACDGRWRVREAVVMALQRLGEADFERLAGEMATWAEGGPLEQRAAVAAVCEPRLLRDRANARAALALLETVTARFDAMPERRRDGMLTLRQALGYCWSVAVAAAPDDGKPAMERWLAVDDPDIRWIMRENLRKSRLARGLPDWTRHWSAKLDAR